MDSSGAITNKLTKSMDQNPEENNIGLSRHFDVRAHHVTILNTPIHNTPSTDPQLSISQKALGTFPEDGNVMPKHVGATIHN
jgi:hypothetical protein